MTPKTPLLLGLGLTLACARLFASPGESCAAVPLEELTQTVRDRAGLAPEVRLTASALSASQFRGFCVTNLELIDQKMRKATVPVYVPTSGRYFALGKLAEIPGEISEPVVRSSLGVGLDTVLQVGPPSLLPELGVYELPIRLRTSAADVTDALFMTAGRDVLIRGKLIPAASAVPAALLKDLAGDGPAIGPVNARLTIIEFGDMRCGQCAALHQALVNDIVPRYQPNVRVVFKEHPATALNSWSWTASIASACVHSLKPDAFAEYRSRVFGAQDTIRFENARNTLVSFAAEVGVTESALASCIDSQESRRVVENSLRQGRRVGVGILPTMLVNGAVVSGFHSTEDLKAVIERELKRVEDRTPCDACAAGLLK